VFLPICLSALILLAAVGGTMAYLTSSPEAVVNTFTVGDIDIKLEESPYSKVNGEDSYGTPKERVVNSYPMIPGKVYTKDPVVTVIGNEKNIDVYLFIKCTADMDDGLVYQLNKDGWTDLVGETGVYYREVTASTEDQSFSLIENNRVTVSADLVREDTMPEENSTLTFKAYAIQTETFSSAEDAWKKVSK